MTEASGRRQDAIAVVEEELLLLSAHRGSQAAPRVLERSAYLLLTRLDLGGAMTMKDLAESFGLDASTVNRQVNSLLRLGYAEKVADPSGAANRLRPTAEGRRRLAEQRSVRSESITGLLADWSPEDRETFATLLCRFNVSVETRHGIDWPRDDAS